MKKEYQKPFTLLVKMETEGDFLMDSLHGTHEGFTETTQDRCNFLFPML